MKTDVRVAKTKRDLKNALIGLLEKDYSFEKITVSVICETARVNRVTFYSHYKDKFDLSHDIMGDIIQNVVSKSADEAVTDYQKFISFCMNLVEHAIEECFTYKKILYSLSKEDSILSFMLNSAIQKSLTESVGQFAKVKTIKYDLGLVCSFLCGGLSKLILDWMFNCKNISREQFSKGLQAAVSDCLKYNILFEE